MTRLRTEVANRLLTAPILPTLLRLSLPNLAAMLTTALVAIAETSYIGVLGTTPLAAMALVFPMVMLMQMMSAGAMGGGVSSAISRALGGGDKERARSLAVHAAAIGLAAGLGFTLVFLTYGPAIYYLLGGRGAVLEHATLYSNTVFLGAVGIWLLNTLAAVVRGTGNMRVPSATLLAVAALQICIGGSLGLGIGPVPRFGLPGVALGQVIAFAIGALFLLWFLRSGRAALTLHLAGARPSAELFADILKVGALAVLSPLQSVATVLILTRLVAGFGAPALAGYGIGARLEFLLVPIAFSVGVACVPMVGMAMGARDYRRARRVAWTGALVSAVGVGLIGTLVVARPELWTDLFTSDPAVRAAGALYLSWAAPAFAPFGLGLCLYFASQGAGKVLGPVLASTLRLIIVGIGGWWLLTGGAPLWAMFALVAAAMSAYGLATAAAVYITPWHEQRPAVSSAPATSSVTP
jgi:putative MATE family efflux protein